MTDRPGLLRVADASWRAVVTWLAMAVGELARLSVLAASAGLLLWPPMPSVAQETSWRQAVDRLAEEKGLAEGCASVLKTFGDQAPMARVQGRRLYARARADVDGLVALLKVDLADDRSPAAIPELRYRLEAVPRQRQALCQYVRSTLGPAVREQPQRSHAVELLTEGGVDAESALLAAAVEIWEAYRRAGQADRERIIPAIEGTRWRDYPEIPPSMSR